MVYVRIKVRISVRINIKVKVRFVVRLISSFSHLRILYLSRHGRRIPNNTRNYSTTKSRKSHETVLSHSTYTAEAAGCNVFATKEHCECDNLD